MAIIGLVGSPRKDGRTFELVQAALQGAASSGADTQLVYLADYALRPYTGTGDSAEAYTFCPSELSTLCREADALVVGAPVYWGDISGLCKDWMDTVRMPVTDGKPGLAIAIAGGSGKGLLSGVQSISHFFYHKQMRCVEPVPVSRFNMAEAQQALTDRGAELADLAASYQPFEGESINERWIDCTAYYGLVRYMRADPVDEFVLLAQQLVAERGDDCPPEAEDALVEALRALSTGNRAEAGRHAVRCYHMLFH